MAIDRIVDPEADHEAGCGFLVGQTALITGAARRIGRALALGLARRGADVVVHHRRSEEQAVQTVAEIAEAGGRAWTCAADLADPGQAQDLVARAEKLAGQPIRILINNASVFARDELETTTRQAWDLNHDVNLRAPFLLAQAFTGRLPDGQAGNIINLNDIRALRPGADHFPYTISKVGLHGLTASLAQALAPRIRVNELALGAVLPPEGAAESYVHTLRAEIPTGRFGSPDEVTAAALFLLASDNITGQTICIDGGRHLV